MSFDIIDKKLYSKLEKFQQCIEKKEEIFSQEYALKNIGVKIYNK